MSLDEALAIAASSRDAAVEELVEELKIASVSTLPEHRDECRRNADWLVTRLEGLGFTSSLTDVINGGHPVLRADWMGRPGAPVLTIYGHYDVQPPDPLDEWISPPFEPVVTNGLVVARGCADNKGNHMAAIRAVDAWMQAGGPPCNVRFLIEGEEEIGGESLPIYVRNNAADLATDGIAIWDGGFSSDGQPALCVGLRGLLYVDVILNGTKTDLHSGGFGGVAPNACDALAGVLAALHDETRAITVPGFYDEVRTPDADEMSRWHRDPEGPKRFEEMMGTTLFGEESFSLEERRWTRPTLEVNGFIGGFTGHGAKTVIPARASAKVSMRLVPDQDPSKVLASLESHLQSLAPRGTTIEVHPHTSSPPVLLGADHALARSAMTAWQGALGEECVLVRTGGSIPVTTAFAEALNAPMIIGGVSSTDSGAHGPNEKLRLKNYYGGIDMMIRLMREFADSAH